MKHVRMYLSFVIPKRFKGEESAFLKPPRANALCVPLLLRIPGTAVPRAI